jgi:hypothetical protein
VESRAGFWSSPYSQRIYKYQPDTYNTEIWMAFYGLEDYQRGNVAYADVNDLLDVTHYDMDIDLRENKKYVRLLARVQAQTMAANLRAISFRIGEDLGESESRRLKKQMRLEKVRLAGSELPFAQEDWEGGFTVFIPPDPVREKNRISSSSCRATSCLIPTGTATTTIPDQLPRGFLGTAILIAQVLTLRFTT